MAPWANESRPDGGDFYWTPEVLSDGPHDGWTMPTDDPFLLDTSNPEELLLDPEDFDLLPTEIQSGETDWTVEDPPEDS